MFARLVGALKTNVMKVPSFEYVAEDNSGAATVDEVSTTVMYRAESATYMNLN